MFHMVLMDESKVIKKQLKDTLNELAFTFQIVAEVNDVDAALTFLKINNPHIFVVSFNLSFIEGIKKIIACIEQRDLRTQVVVLTECHQLKSALQSIAYGVGYYILKPIQKNNVQAVFDSLVEKLTDSCLKQKDMNYIFNQNKQVMYELLSHDWSNTQLLNLYSQLDVNHQADYLFIFIELNSYPNIVANEYYHPNINQIIVQSISKTILGTSYNSFFSMRGKLALLVQAKGEQVKEELEHKLARVQSDLNLIINSNVLLYIGDSASGLYFFEEAYRSALVTGQYKYIDNRTMFYYEDIKDFTKINNVYDDQCISQLLKSVIQGNELNIQAEIEALFMYIGHIGCSVELLKAILHKCVAETLKLIKQYNIKPESIKHLSDILYIEQYNTVREELMLLMYEYFISISNNIRININQ